MTATELLKRNCKLFREQSGMTQQAVADAIGKSIDAVRSWEQTTKDKRAPERDSLMVLARLYGRPMDHFFMETPPPAVIAVQPEYEVRFKSVGPVPRGYLEELEAVRRKWTPDRMSEHTDIKKQLKRGKKR
jgi:transcriptional regulator with XRE-family HTH domain